LLRTRVIVVAAEQGDVILGEPAGEKKPSQVFLRCDRFGKNNGLAAAMTVPPQIQHHLNRFLKGTRLGIVRKRPRAGDEVLDADQLGGKGRTINRRERFLGSFFDFVLVLKIPEYVDHGVVGT
jgi:hypothetical protein